MKLNKKILFLILISIISFSLTGCFDGVKKVTNIPESKKEKEISLGVWNENVYSNSFFDIKYTMPDNWSKLSDDDLAKLMDLSFEAYKDIDDYIKEVAKQITIYHFSTNNPNTGDNVQLLSESTIMDLTEDYYVYTLSSYECNGEGFCFHQNHICIQCIRSYIWSYSWKIQIQRFFIG